MEQVLLLSYGVIKHDGPLNSLVKVCENVGTTHVVSFATSDEMCENFVLISSRNDRNKLMTLLKHILKSISCAKRIKRMYVLISDDFTSTMSASIVRLLFKPSYYVHYARELYLDTKMPGFGKLFLYIEKCACRAADTVVCCNNERATIMHEKYRLKEKPMVLENIRRLSGDYDSNALDEKYAGVLKDGVRLIETGGCEIERGTLNLVKAVAQLPQCYLYIVGKGHEKDYRTILEYITNNDVCNVYILDRVPLSELRYLVDKCHIGVVIYHKNDLNNIYCASGKVYEYLFEGLPIITTENDSLVSICEQHHVGVADDRFIDGIQEIIRNMEEYRNAVKLYRESISIDTYIKKFSLKLIEAINKKGRQR